MSSDYSKPDETEPLGEHFYVHEAVLYMTYISERDEKRPEDIKDRLGYVQLVRGGS